MYRDGWLRVMKLKRWNSHDTYGYEYLTRCITRKYPQQFLICIVSDWVLVAVKARVRVQVNMINLMLGDCLERMKEIPDGSVDMVLADPPYGTTDCKWDSVIPLEPMWEQLKRIIKPNGVIVLFSSQPFTSVLVTSNLKM